MITLREGKNILFENINQWFNSHGYCLKDSGDGQFLKETEYWIYAIGFNFFHNTNKHFNTTIRMHSKDVEALILECGIPNINLDSYKKGDNLLFTVHDKENLKSYMSKMKTIDLTKSEGYLEWSKLILSYMSNEANDFIGRYSYMPNILQAIENIESEGHQNYLALIEGGVDHLFRVLIVSKLCGDEGYDNRIKKLEELILKPKYSEWHDHFERLKVILENTKSLSWDKIS